MGSMHDGTHASLQVERFLDGSILKQRMWIVFNPSLLFILFQPFFCQGFLVWYGTVTKKSLHVNLRSRFLQNSTNRLRLFFRIV